MFPRSIALIFVSIWDVVYHKADVVNVGSQGRKLLIARASIGAVGMPWYFIALKYLPMSKGSIIVNFAPLIGKSILNYFKGF